MREKKVDKRGYTIPHKITFTVKDDLFEYLAEKAKIEYRAIGHYVKKAMLVEFEDYKKNRKNIDVT